MNALEDQIQEAKDCISSFGWELADGYIDEGKSGTSVRKRNEYKRLFEDLQTDRFDVLVIKSQDRLMRNTREWYLFIDRLVTNSKKLYFYLENKFYTPDDGLLTGIKAILAEEYSRDLSKKIKNAHRNRQEKGKSIVITSATWGYDKIDKKVVVNEEEAEVVRLIYDMCVQGYGSRSISKELSNRGVFSRSGGHFPEVTIRRIIRNPLYKGTVIMNKKSIDFNTKRLVVNPEAEWRFHENAVPAIVTSDVWEEANKRMDRRAREVRSDDCKKKTVGKKTGRHALSSKMFCGLCGSVYWRRYRRRGKNKEEIIMEWSCSEYVTRGRNKAGKEKKEVMNTVVTTNCGCDNVHLKESDVLLVLTELANDILYDKKNEMIQHVINILRDVLREEEAVSEERKVKRGKENILKQKDLLMDKLLNGIITDVDYKRKDAELEKKLSGILEKEKVFGRNEFMCMDLQGRLDGVKEVLNEMDTGKIRLGKLMEHIDKIIVYSGQLEVYLDFHEKIMVNV